MGSCTQAEGIEPHRRIFLVAVAFSSEFLITRVDGTAKLVNCITNGKGATVASSALYEVAKLLKPSLPISLNLLD